MSDFKERLADEVSELETKVSDLNDFMESDAYSDIPREHQRLLGLQRGIMTSYVGVLNQRIELLNTEESQSDEEE